MAKFEIGETIICSIEIRNAAGALVDPATSTTVIILNPDGAEVLNVAMDNDGLGLFHKDYTSAATVQVGTYTVWYIAVDGTRITKQKDTFELEP